MDSRKSRFHVLTHVRWEHCIAGVSGGVLSTLILHPLDLIKIRFQVNETSTSKHLPTSTNNARPQYRGILHAFSTIGKTDGVKGLYQGVTPNVWGAGASWGLYFLFYNTLKQRLLESHGTKTLPASQHMVAAAEAGVITLVLTNPIWVAKTRLCLQYDQGSPSRVDFSNPKQYRGMFDCLVKTYQVEGIRGLYKGFLPGLIGVSHGTLQFMGYEELKKIYNSYKKAPADAKFNSAEYIGLAAISKVFAASATYPYQVVRSRLQDQHRCYKGMTDVIVQTWKHEQLRGFYKGLGPYMLHVTPNICMVFLIYEHVTNAVEQRRVRHRLANQEVTDMTISANLEPPGATTSDCDYCSDLMIEIIAMESDSM